jgi:hypothetical protein
MITVISVQSVTRKAKKTLEAPAMRPISGDQRGSSWEHQLHTNGSFLTTINPASREKLEQ